MMSSQSSKHCAATSRNRGLMMGIRVRWGIPDSLRRHPPQPIPGQRRGIGRAHGCAGRVVQRAAKSLRDDLSGGFQCGLGEFLHPAGKVVVHQPTINEKAG
jgi:hypothetical protein